MQLTSPEVLHGLGVIADRERAPFVLEKSAGERITMTLSPARISDFSSWRMAGGVRRRYAAALPAAFERAVVD